MYETMNVLAALLCYVVISFQVIGAIYFTRTNYKFCINAPGGHVVGQIQAVLNVTDTCTKDDLQYFIFSQLPVPFEVGKDGVISVSNTSAIKTDTPFVLALRASCMGHSAAVPVTVFAKERGECPCQQNVQDTPTQTMCFQHPVIHLHVEENQKNISFGPLSDCQLGSSSVLDREYRVTEGSYEGKPWTETFSVDAKSGNITLLGALDREKSEDISLKMICFVFKDGVVIRNDTAEVKIKIGDVNDNMIFLHLGGKKLRNANVTIPSSKSDASIVLEDADSFDCSTHRVEVVLDPKDACTGNIVTDTIIGPPLSPVKHVCQLSVQTDRSKLLGKVEPYRCQIAIIDPTYIITKGEERSVSNQQSILDVIIDIERDIVLDARKDIFIEAEVPKAAPKLTRVAQLPLSLTNNNYYVIEKQQGKAISVTLKSGIVYVDDASKLTEPVHNVTVARIDKEKKYFHIVVKVKRTLLRDNENCSISCSRFKSKKACESSCGIGATAGRCTWRGHFRSGQMTSGYETCTYSDNKCPDQECDDLEKIYPALCPQDCTNKTTGPIVLKVDKIGIKSAAAPVYCDYNFHCHIIFMDEAHQSLTSANEGVTLPNITEIDTNHSLGLLTSQDWQRAEIHEGGLEACDVNCRTTIAATIGCLGAVICLFVLAWKLRRLKCHSGQRLQKHVGSSVSVSAVPSDYQDDRELQRTLHNSPQWVPKGPLEYTQMPEDLKWEFERENLVLEKTIGEGEFGKVMKAKASNIDGKDGVKDVAVKMLKDCASGAELRDLLSEYSLLRDVNHPNVVRLLGACTKNGPVYIIVEYCEHGSLLHFMRRSRLEENGYVNQRMRHREMIRNNTSGEWIEPELLTMGDLLSFAWQIAKGMKYLSEIKLVHRDLAARNVLVASGKILKISDFGLTRDVYEADTYLKQSKGRIPVKWLAPESLYAQIYTTQSDVWSYGIVLWEIVTLGAPPYPGIPPERLYSLLVAGYRMDKPDHCTDELYAVMQKCWKIEQQERPTFALLVDIVDRLLQQRTEYLDLMTGGTDDTRPEFYDKCFGNTEVQDKNPSIANTQVQSVAKNGISVISGDIEPYLIPISRRDLCPQIGSSDQTINGQVDSVVKNTSNKCLDFTQKPSSGEQLSLLFDSGTARFSPSSDNEDDWESRETDVLPVI